MTVTLRRRENPLILISHTQQDANTQDYTNAIYFTRYLNLYEVIYEWKIED
jgi:hypothetical protein